MTVERWHPPERVAEAMARASVLVIPSQFEVAPVAVAEAWALRVPVVATRVGGMSTFANGAAALVPRERHRSPTALSKRCAEAPRRRASSRKGAPGLNRTARRR